MKDTSKLFKLTITSVVGLVCAILMALVLVKVYISDREVSPVNEPLKEYSPEIVGVGMPITFGGVTYVVKSVANDSSEKNPSSTSKYVAVTLEATNNTSSPVKVDDQMFSLLDNDKKVYKSDPYHKLSKTDHFMMVNEINPGISKEGTVFFEVPSAINDFVFAIRDDVLDYSGAKYVFVDLRK